MAAVRRVAWTADVQGATPADGQKRYRPGTEPDRKGTGHRLDGKYINFLKPDDSQSFLCSD